QDEHDTSETKTSANPNYRFVDVELLQAFKPLIVTCYVVLLIYVICCSCKMHSVTSFIRNLAFSDLLICVTCVPFTLAYAFTPHSWPVTVSVSVFTPTAIAVPCYRAPSEEEAVRRGLCHRPVGDLGGVMRAGVPCRGPHLPEEGLTICEEYWLGEERWHLAYAYSTLLLTYVLPLSAVCGSYFCLSVRLRSCVAPGQAEAQRSRRRRTPSLVVAVFTGCWLPIHIFNVLRDVDIRVISKRHFLLVQLLCHLCAMSSACCNPFLYAWLHQRFRTELRKTLACPRPIRIPANRAMAASMVL
uniref:G-protein coupled receptors family 1 profile domain-containing protein n=1 Tax=Electrophorus electricus TaxID=8005 RepID=A0A4W4FTX9_ELEEL